MGANIACSTRYKYVHGRSFCFDSFRYSRVGEDDVCRDFLRIHQSLTIIQGIVKKCTFPAIIPVSNPQLRSSRVGTCGKTSIKELKSLLNKKTGLEIHAYFPRFLGEPCHILDKVGCTAWFTYEFPCFQGKYVDFSLRSVVGHPYQVPTCS